MYDPGRCRGGGFGRRAKKVVKMISPVRVFLSLFLKKKKKKPHSNNHGPFVLNSMSGAVTPPYADQSTMLLVLEFV